LGARYREMEIKTATPEMVVVKLYEGALRLIRSAKASQEAGQIAARATAIGKALAIVNELQQSLNLELGGEIARNLDSLYFYINDRLIEANIRGSVQPLDEASGVLSTLNEAWVEISKRPRGAAADWDPESDVVASATARARATIG
jgi:flagellar protein FliS